MRFFATISTIVGLIVVCRSVVSVVSRKCSNFYWKTDQIFSNKRTITIRPLFCLFHISSKALFLFLFSDASKAISFVRLILHSITLHSLSLSKFHCSFNPILSSFMLHFCYGSIQIDFIFHAFCYSKNYKHIAIFGKTSAPLLFWDTYEFVKAQSFRISYSSG